MGDTEGLSPLADEGRGEGRVTAEREQADFHGLSVPPGQDSPYRPTLRGKGAATNGDAGRPLMRPGSPRRAASRSPTAAGPQTFGRAYMPFAAGFDHMAGEAPVYRSSRLHALNPTAAVSEDTSYLYTLDSGAETPATRAANPHKSAEHVRNTAAGASAKGGLAGKIFAPIR